MVSFIIPLHNIQHQYFKRCLESFTNQKEFHEIEIILVNDNCPIVDNHLLCLTYEKKYKNFKYIKLDKNVGVSTARFIGLSCANKKFCCFWDSDDFLENDCLSTLFAILKQESEFFDIWKGVEKFVDAETLETLGISNNEIVKLHNKKNNCKLSFYKNSMIGGKILKTNLAKDVSLFSQKIQNHEDLYFVISYLLKIDTDRIGKINKEIFNISVRKGSASNNPDIYKKCTAFLYYTQMLLLQSYNLTSDDFYKNKNKTKFFASNLMNYFFYDLILLFEKEYIHNKKNVMSFYKKIKNKIKKSFFTRIPKAFRKKISYIKRDANFLVFCQWLKKHNLKITIKLIYFVSKRLSKDGAIKMLNSLE